MPLKGAIGEAEGRFEASASTRGLRYEPDRASLRPFFRGRRRDRRRAERLGIDLDGFGGWRDHGRILYRGRSPAVFVAEPYVLHAEDLAELDLLRKLPLRVDVSADGLWCLDPRSIRVEVAW